jgi:hypothetical protein
LFLFFVVVVAIGIVVGVVRWYVNKTKRSERNKFIMIDKILSE